MKGNTHTHVPASNTNVQNYIYFSVLGKAQIIKNKMFPEYS